MGETEHASPREQTRPGNTGNYGEREEEATIDPGRGACVTKETKPEVDTQIQK